MFTFILFNINKLAVKLGLKKHPRVAIRVENDKSTTISDNVVSGYDRAIDSKNSTQLKIKGNRFK